MRDKLTALAIIVLCALLAGLCAGLGNIALQLLFSGGAS